MTVGGACPSELLRAADKAYADIKYHNAIIKGLSIVAHNGGYFVGFPAPLAETKNDFRLLSSLNLNAVRLQPKLDVRRSH
jgi:hypothetical protein